MQHPGAELSAHDTITVEQDFWGSLAQLAAEYDTIAQTASRNRWITLLETGGLKAEVIDGLVESESFGILTTELRRLEADGHDITDLLPRIIAAGGLDGAEDLGSLLRYRLLRIAVSYRPSPQRAVGLVAGLVPRAAGITEPAMRQALAEREQLMEGRLDALVGKLLEHPEPWMAELGELAPEEQTKAARAVAAYPDRWGITSSSPLGAVPGDDAQRIDYERTQAQLSAMTSRESEHAAALRSAPRTSERRL